MNKSEMQESDSVLDFVECAAELETLLKLRSIPFGMKLFESAEDVDRIPRIRKPQAVHTLDQIVAQCARLGWTVAVRGEDLVGDQCRSVVGLGGQDSEWYSGKKMAGVWYATVEDSRKHQSAMHVVPSGRYRALVVAPLGKWGGKTASRSNPVDRPDIALFYATPGAMMHFVNGLQWKDYQRFDWSVVGESSCADSWGRALATGEPSLTIPCFGERRYGGVLDDELLMALRPEHLVKAIDGMRALSRNGLRYPVPQYGIQQDVRAGLQVSYGNR